MPDDNKPKNKIIVKKDKKNPDDRQRTLVHTNFILKPQDDATFQPVPLCNCSDCKTRNERESRELLNFSDEVGKIEGISSLIVYRYSVFIEKETAFSWDDLLPKVVEIIKKVWLGPDIEKYDLECVEKPYDESDNSAFGHLMIVRQQEVMKGLKKKISGIGIIGDPGMLKDILSSLPCGDFPDDFFKKA